MTLNYLCHCSTVIKHLPFSHNCSKSSIVSLQHISYIDVNNMKLIALAAIPVFAPLLENYIDRTYCQTQLSGEMAMQSDNQAKISLEVVLFLLHIKMHGHMNTVHILLLVLHFLLGIMC